MSLLKKVSRFYRLRSYSPDGRDDWLQSVAKNQSDSEQGSGDELLEEGRGERGGDVAGDGLPEVGLREAGRGEEGADAAGDGLRAAGRE